MKLMEQEQRGEFRRMFRKMVETIVNDRAFISYPNADEEAANSYFAADLSLDETVRVVITEGECLLNSRDSMRHLVLDRTKAALVVLRSQPDSCVHNMANVSA